MGYAETMLADGERITFRDRQHWLAPLIHGRRAIIVVLVAILLFGLSRSISGALNTVLTYLGLVVLAAGVLWLALIVARWRAEAFLVTNRRIVKITGLINKHTADSGLEMVNDVVLDQSLLGRILGYGDLGILTGAKADGDRDVRQGEVDHFAMLAHAIAFKIAMLNAKEALESEGIRPTR